MGKQLAALKKKAAELEETRKQLGEAILKLGEQQRLLMKQAKKKG